MHKLFCISNTKTINYRSELMANIKILNAFTELTMCPEVFFFVKERGLSVFCCCFFIT